MSKIIQPLSIVVPALNEAGNLRPLVERISKPLAAEGIEHEILIVDDHSTDDTAVAAERLSNSYPVRVVSKVGKRGKAYSLLQGFDEVQYPLICMIDADLQYPPEAILPMYHKLVNHDADIVVTNRVEHKSSPLRQLSTKVSHFLLARLLFGIDYDTQSGLKLFKRKVLNNMDLHPSAWSFDLEFLIRSLENHAIILSHPIPFGERFSGETKVKLFSGAITVINSSLKLRMNSSVRKVRRGYLASLELSKRPVGLLGLLAGGMLLSIAMLSSVQSPQASALSLNDVRHVFSSDTQNKQTTTAATAAAPASNTGTNNSGTSSNGKSTNYYPEYALSNSKTSQLTKVAATLGLAGAAAVVLGLLTWGGRVLYLRHVRRTSRNLYQV